MKEHTYNKHTSTNLTNLERISLSPHRAEEEATDGMNRSVHNSNHTIDSCYGIHNTDSCYDDHHITSDNDISYSKPNLEEQKQRTGQQNFRAAQAATSVSACSIRSSNRSSIRSDNLPPESPKPPRPCEFKGADSIHHFMISCAAPTLDSRRSPATPLCSDLPAACTTPGIKLSGTAAETEATESAMRTIKAKAIARPVAGRTSRLSQRGFAILCTGLNARDLAVWRNHLRRREERCRGPSLPQGESSFKLRGI